MSVLQERVVADIATAQSHIFNHDIMHCTSDEVIGNDLYSGRALGLTEAGDILQLHPHISSEWPYITEHYDRIGLRHTSDVIWDLSYRHIMENPQLAASVFFYGTAVDMVVHNKDWYAVVSYINSKNNFMDLAEHLAMDIPKTTRLEGKGQFVHQKDICYPCYVKAAISVSGTGIFRCANEAELIEALKTFEADVPIQIQEEVQTGLFLNVQYQITDGKLQRLAISEQLLDGYMHQGNRYPASHEPWESVEPMAIWMLEHGMQGIFAFDVGVLETATGTRYMPIECNPRYNGASYPTIVANKLAISQWLARQLSTRHRSLGDIDLSGIEYNPQTGEGIVIVNWGCVQAGKLGVLFAGDEQRQAFYETALSKRL